MNLIPDIKILQQLDWFLTLILFIILIAFSWFIYRRTNPIVRPYIKYLLTFFRCATLVLLMWIILEPLIRLIFFQNEKATIAVLVDNSASMSLDDNGKKRSDEVRKFFASPEFKSLKQAYNLEIWPFSTALSESQISLNDSIRFDGSGTDIQAALEQLAGQMAEKYWTATVLLSDGLYNTGANPIHYASEIGQPIFPVAIGDPTPKKDLLIVEVLANDVTYVDNISPVSIRLRNIGYENLRVPVHLKLGEKIIASQEAQFTASPAEKTVQMQFIPKQEGMQKYTVALGQQSDEATFKNNSQVFYCNVLKSKIKVLVFAGAPSSDVAFLYRVLASEENINPKIYIEKKGGSYYQNIDLADLDDFDIFCLVNFPTDETPNSIISRLIQVGQQKAKPVFLLAGNRIAMEQLLRLKDFLPINGRIITKNSSLVNAQMVATGSDHPILSFASGRDESLYLMQQLPPVLQNYNADNLWPDAQVLLTTGELQGANTKSKAPLLAVRQFGKQKSIAIFAYQLWRWDLMMWGINKTNDLYIRLITNSMKWLASGLDEKRVRVSTNKQKYHNREPIDLTTQVYTEDYKPARGVNVTAMIQKENKVIPVNFQEAGDGFYRASATVLEPGDYQCLVKAEKEGVELGTDETKFTIGEFNLEMQDVKMNAVLLQTLAQNSGGKFLTTSETKLLEHYLNFPVRKTETTREIELFNNRILFVLIVTFLAFEWFLRKRKGMV